MMQYPNIDPIIFSIGSISIKWYAIAYLMGIFLGFAYAKFINAHLNVISNWKMNDEIIQSSAIGIILGGRIGYILLYNPVFYFSHPIEIFKIWHGGMSFHGGAIGVIIAMIWFANSRKINIKSLLDVVACVVPIGLFFGRLANFINMELIGRETQIPWAVILNNTPRHPSQIYEALMEGMMLFLILNFLLWKTTVRKKPGVLSGMFIVGYGIMRCIAEIFRVPDGQIGFFFGIITLGQILSFIMIILGIAFMQYSLYTNTNVKRCNAINSRYGK